MDAIFSELTLSYITWPELALRVGLAALFGLIIGYDRDSKNKPIDFRAYMIVAMTTCIVAIMGQELYADFNTADKVVSVDLAKIIAGVLTGIGFLGAGAIIKRENDQVVGTATGASIWASGGIGLTLGFGMYLLAIAEFMAVSLILVIGGYFIPHIQGEKDKEKQTDSQ